MSETKALEQAFKEMQESLPDAVRTLVWLVKHGKRETIRQRAAVALLDRGGLPPGQKIEVTGPDGADVFAGMPVEEIRRLARTDRTDK